ncbi:MAG: S8 family serine peptidase, partial [candidate division WOR-3 bacterium]
GVRGQRLVLGITDTGLNVYGPGHVAFRDSLWTYSGPAIYPGHRKVVCYKLNQADSNPISRSAFGEKPYHGSHVCGSVAGDDAYWGGTSYHDGTANKARIYFVDISDESGRLRTDDDLTELWDTVFSGRGLPDSARPRQHSGSWGAANSGFYQLREATTDAFLWRHRDCLILMSAGNRGAGPFTIGSPASAKNVITVGALLNGTSSNTVASFSSRGPTVDHRLKPTLCVPGDGPSPFSGIWSSYRNPATDLYWPMCGTSMAAPLCNGAVGLIRCYLKEGYYPYGSPYPCDTFGYISAALLRAMAIVSADPGIGDYQVPDPNVGWGRINLDSVLAFTGDKRKLIIYDDTLGLATGQMWQSTFHNDSANIPLRVALVWTDTAGAPYVTPTLVNNLHLELDAPGGTYYRGNQYANGQSIANPTVWDNLNTEECCRVNRPDTGTWTLKVWASNVPATRQPFALAITGAVSSAMAAHDVLSAKVATPSGIVDSGTTVIPACSVYNCGNRTETFNVRMKISDGYNAAAQVTNLAPSTWARVLFAPWTARSRGSNAVSCSTELTGDEAAGNDKALGQVRVMAHDVAARVIKAPAAVVDSGIPLVPACSLFNYGNAAEGPYAVWMKIGSAYSALGLVLSHPAGANGYVTFPAWTPPGAGTFAVSCSTCLTIDGNRANDRVSGSVTVAAYDLAPLEIVAPRGRIAPGAAAPQVVVHNYGNSRESCAVWCRINSSPAYSQIVVLRAGLPSGDTTLIFPSWTAVDSGDYLVRCTTLLALDQIPANDAVQSQFSVYFTDVAVSEISYPNRLRPVDTAAVIVPVVQIQNLGELPASFKTYLVITGPVNWSDSILVPDTCQLPPLTSKYVVFDSWPKPHPIGNYTARCSTWMFLDGNSRNDTLSSSFSIVPPQGDWTRMADFPLGPKGKKVKDGAALACFRSGPSDASDVPGIYALKGNGTCEFYAYNTATNTWATRESIPVFGRTQKKKAVKKG